MTVNSISRRWLTNSLLIIIILLLLGASAFWFFTRNTYYSASRQLLMNEANLVSDAIDRVISQDTLNANAELKNIIENFEKKDKIEIQALSKSGSIVISSLGFEYETSPNIPDFATALTNPNGIGEYIGSSVQKEKIMSICVLLPYMNSEYSAVRYVVSLKKVEDHIFMFMLAYLCIALIIVIIVMISGAYFIKSIIIPVKDVTIAARRFATGDYSARLNKINNDELGELCDVINYMADELGSTEQIKNDFMSSISHELRTPLTAIKGWSETLSTTPIDERETLEKGMHIISSETERLSTMVEELLDFSRMQSGRFVLNKAKIDILAEIEEAVIIFTQRAIKENKSLLYSIPDTVSYLFADKNRLRQVFINVLDNAFKYSKPSGIISVTVFEDADKIHIKIEDKGCGISSQDLPYIKDKFYKANMSIRGSGIGLSVADEIIRQHDGKLLITSTVDVGTTVTIILPKDKEKEKDKE